MQFYKIDGFIADKAWVEANDSREISRKNARSICSRTTEFNRSLNKEDYFFVVEIDGDAISCGAIIRRTDLFSRNLEKFFKAINLKVEDIQFEEIVLDGLENGLNLSSRNLFIEDEDDVLYQFELHLIRGRYMRDIDYDEHLLEGLSKDVMVDKVHRYLLNETLMPEINRIYGNCKKVKSFGHPVHYMIQTDNRDVRKDIYEILLNALYDNNRIINKRFAFTTIAFDSSCSQKLLDVAYNACEGGAFIINYLCQEDVDGQYASSDRENIRKICECATKYRNKVLTILSLPREATKTVERMNEELSNMCFVSIREDFAKNDAAIEYLKMLAKENYIKPDKKLTCKVIQDEGYLSADLRKIFDEWYDVKLRTTVYPQYKNLLGNRSKIRKEKPKGSAYSELMAMTGLSEAKDVIQKALDYYKAQKLFRDKGMKAEHPAMHMIFTGNPGSAKTTCARLFAEIMKENGLLSKGHIVEVGRADLVGKYVGWTASIVKRKFADAKGGVLFIDEAYSLVDDKDGLFGDEAINTIVQEMENMRDELIVIFAGYPDKMEAFLDKNPGLRSRIAFHVPFEDYSVEELCSIAGYIAKEKGLHFTNGAMDKLRNIFEHSSKQKDFGNGRLVRNIMEKARMAQASRLIAKDFDEVTRDDIATITEDDIEELKQSNNHKEQRHIGFCA